MAMYGVELADPPEASLIKLCPAIVTCIARRRYNRKVVLTYENSRRNGRDLDPAYIMVQQRVVQLRRACERDPRNKGKAKRILKKYADRKEPATEEGNEGLYGEPCCHPNLGNRTQWKAESDPRGPVGFMLQSINLLGGIVTKNFVIDMQNEAMLPITDAPFQS